MWHFLTRPSSLRPVIHIVISNTHVRAHFLESIAYFEISPEITIDQMGLIEAIGDTARATASRIGEGATYIHLFHTPNALQRFKDTISPFMNYIIAKSIYVMVKEHPFQVIFARSRTRVIAEIDPQLYTKISTEDVDVLKNALHSPYCAIELPLGRSIAHGATNTRRGISTTSVVSDPPTMGTLTTAQSPAQPANGTCTKRNSDNRSDMVLRVPALKHQGKW